MSPLKQKIIDQYNYMISDLRLGKIYNYDNILNMLSFLEVGSHTKNPYIIQEYLLR